MQLTSLQEKKVNEIVNFFQKGVKEVAFKAPTGSGKTLMATSVISKIINNNLDKKFIFIIATISSSELPIQFERKINEYKSDLEYKDFDVEYVESPSSSKSNKNKSDAQPQIKLEKNKVYIFGKATFGKGRIFTEYGIIEDFLMECKQQDYKIVYIRDEAHIGGEGMKKADVENFEKIMNSNSDFVLKMTATFKDIKSDVARVELKESELINENYNDGKWLIKCNVDQLYNDTFDDKKLLENAIEKFKEIKEEYRKLEQDGIFIRPAMLIQVDNEPGDKDQDKKKLYFDTLKMIKEELKKANFSWVKYFGSSDKESSNADNENFTLNKITRNNDTTDCIIFKIGPATGWDIPRACMLLQLRDVSSQSLKIQTIGRIKRNPYPNLEKNDITDKYYLYSNEEKSNEKDYSIYEYTIKEKFKNEIFISIEIDNNGTKQELVKNTIKEEVKKFLNDNKSSICQKIDECFKENKYINKNEKIIIDNTILLLKLLKTKESNLNSNQKLAFSIIEKEYKNYDSLKNQKIESIKIILLSFFMKNINDIIQKSLSQNIKYRLVETNLKPDSYRKIYDNEKDVATINDNYLFNIKKDGKEYKKQVFDSENEPVVFNRIKDYLVDNKNCIKVLAKNPTTGNIYGEYFDENNYKRRSYFDFIAKFDNGNILYIEVKGEKDIDLEKTKLLEKAYQDYFDKDINGDLFKKFVYICVVRAKNEDIMSIDVFYDKKRTIENLNELSFENLIKRLE